MRSANRGRTADMKRRTSGPRTPQSELSAPVSYVRIFSGVWPGVDESIGVTVEQHPDGQWWARCHVSFPNVQREQWNYVRPFATIELAAACAGAFVVESERLVEAVQRSEDPPMVHRIMAAECGVELDADPALEASRAHGPAEYRRERDAREFAWYRARDFRDYLGRTS